MRRSVLILSLTIAFLVGCVATMAARDFVVPPARAGTDPMKWEGMCAFWSDVGIENPSEHASAKGWNSKLAEFGGQGWEPFAVEWEHGSMVSVCFKRPL
jgi:hypothetical protein